MFYHLNDGVILLRGLVFIVAECNVLRNLDDGFMKEIMFLMLQCELCVHYLVLSIYLLYEPFSVSTGERCGACWNFGRLL